MAFDWRTLVIAIIIFAALTSTSKSYGKWIFSIVMIGILLMFGEKLLPK